MAPPFSTSELDRAGSALSKTGRVTKNALAVQACMSAPSDPRAAAGSSKQPYGQSQGFAGRSDMAEANQYAEQQYGPGPDVSQPESSLTQYLVPG